jgi:hypothetical protein
MAFSKFISFNSEFTQQIFNTAIGALWSINGRLNGFTPSPVGGDTTPSVTPGIVSTTVGGNVTRIITVNLITPTPPDDYRIGAGQLTSYAIANGVVLRADAPFLVNVTITDPVALTDPDPLVIFAEYDDTNSQPVFKVSRESNIDASPTNKAKLCMFEPVSQQWVPMPQLSLGGVFKELEAMLGKFGGFIVTREISAPSTIRVSQGTIIGSEGRVINGGVQFISVPTLPTGLNKRKDLVVVTDPISEATIVPLITILPGIEGLTVDQATQPPTPTSPRQVPLAELLLDSSGVTAVIDVRPVLAWQTGSVLQANPEVFRQMQVTSVQPGFGLTDTTLDTNITWNASVFRALTSATVPGDTKLAFGTVGNPLTRLFSGPVAVPPPAGTPFVPSVLTQFPPAPYTVQTSFRVISQPGTPSEKDVTNDPAYAISFDFLNGIFLNITEFIASEIFEVRYQRMAALFAIDEDGTVHVAALDLLFQHLDPTNASAHTASNIVFNNAVIPIPGITTPTVSVQVALQQLAALSGGGGGTTQAAARSSFTFARNDFSNGANTDHALILGWSTISTGMPITLKVTPYYVMPRAGRITAMSFSMETATGVTNLVTAGVTQAKFSLFVNGSVLAQTDFFTVVGSGAGPYSCFGSNLFPLIIAATVNLNDKVSAAITFDVASAMSGDFGVNAWFEVTDL